MLIGMRICTGIRIRIRIGNKDRDWDSEGRVGEGRGGRAGTYSRKPYLFTNACLAYLT